jgi:hypothetical protein
MGAEDIREWLDARPFVPFRICLTDGKHFEILHPEFVLLTRAVLEIGISRHNGSRLVDQIARVSLPHVVRVETIERAVKKAS